MPSGFGATVGEYRDWLAAELARFPEPVDLVGHDWGGGHVMSVAMSRPDLVRSWVIDVIGVLDQDYVWHQLAQIWQTPGAGESFVAEVFGGDLESRVAKLLELGMGSSVARQVARGQDQARPAGHGS